MEGLFFPVNSLILQKASWDKSFGILMPGNRIYWGEKLDKNSLSPFFPFAYFPENILA